MTAIRDEASVGESTFNGQFGPPSERAVKKLKGHLTPWVQEFVSNAPFVVMATADARRTLRRLAQGRQAGLRQGH